MGKKQGPSWLKRRPHHQSEMQFLKEDINDLENKDQRCFVECVKKWVP